MLNLESIENSKDICIVYHKNCSDGAGAAYGAWKKFGENAEYIAFDYGSNADDLVTRLAGKDVVMLDLSLPKDKLLKALDVTKSIHILDHHLSAYKEIGNFDCCHFDMSQSGAALSWKQFNPNTPIPQFIKYIEDGDLWKFQYPETKAFYAALNEHPLTFRDFEPFEHPDILNVFVKRGAILHKQYMEKVHSIAENAELVRFMGHDIYMVECSRDYASDVGNILATKTNSFSICHSQKENNYKVSLRSVPDCSISQIALLFHGGGHPNASAFVTNTKEDFLNIVRSNKETPIPTEEEIQTLVRERFEAKILGEKKASNDSTMQKKLKLG